ncbi:hypothetical protein [Listeria innocua]|uniref:hypothetical protein n=1 Tax=Listeria innocua TaxID=1642 RepID=UPI00162A7E91|nr:hypothetical protein [Listeria innocua]MBC1925438.1 hypothetical protein [Listeria innocua]
MLKKKEINLVSVGNSCSRSSSVSFIKDLEELEKELSIIMDEIKEEDLEINSASAS